MRAVIGRCARRLRAWQTTAPESAQFRGDARPSRIRSELSARGVSRNGQSGRLIPAAVHAPARLAPRSR